MAEEPATPLVSVVVATNRGGPYLHEALASVAAQTYARIEVLVVDDGSPDPAALREITDRFPGVQVLRIEPSGVSAARNLGVTRTHGALLAFLDDDDRWHPERVARHVERMAAQPSAVVSYCAMRTIDSTGRELVAADQRAAPEQVDVVRGPGVMLPNLVIRRDVYDEIGGFDPAYRQGEDLDLVLRAAALGPFAFVDDVLVDYRHHATNTTRSHRDLATSIRTIVGRHRDAARTAGKGALVTAYDERLRANDRFAAWSAVRAARQHLRDRRLGRALAEIGWAVRFAPDVPVSWARARTGRHARSR
ncbi:glycosyltransferase family 2 protein [Oerskovia flava]|uniref:glycosyltransferase family 2 protein n=1 Tax=Oerskovia flava TaxID=2986422 RepID=UPI0022401BA0|nr:glycosyltransferase family A protein [Oerskovia sp. JB1-3-2]